MNYRTFLGHTHPQIPKSAASTKRSWQSEIYQRARNNAAGHRKEPDLQWTYQETPGLKVNLLLFPSMGWKHFLERLHYDIFPLGFSARWKGVWIIFNRKFKKIKEKKRAPFCLLTKTELPGGHWYKGGNITRLVCPCDIYKPQSKVWKVWKNVTRYRENGNNISGIHLT